MNKFLELDNLIFKSALTLEDKYFLSNFCRNFNLETITTLVNLFEEKPDWIMKFYQNIQAKKKALKQKDKKAWDNMIEKENFDLLEMEIDDIE